MRKSKKKIEYYVFDDCELCGEHPAIWRFWNGKTLCTDCATRSFKKYLVTLAGAAILVIGLLVIS